LLPGLELPDGHSVFCRSPPLGTRRLPDMRGEPLAVRAETERLTKPQARTGIATEGVLLAPGHRAPNLHEASLVGHGQALVVRGPGHRRRPHPSAETVEFPPGIGIPDCDRVDFFWAIPTPYRGEPPTVRSPGDPGGALTASNGQAQRP